MTDLQRMMRLSIVAAFLAARSVTAQNLSPELLGHIKSHMGKELSKLPNYTCLETTHRYHRAASVHAHERHRFQPLDVVRLEVVYVDNSEWYGEPGSRALAQQNPAAFIGSGMIGTGMFAITLHNIFLTDIASFNARGEEAIAGRPALRYDFRLPRFANDLEVSLEEGKGKVGEVGSIWVDPKSLDLLRLESHAEEIPAYLPLATLNLDVDYIRMRIGDSDALLPQQAGLTLWKTTGQENYNRIDFTHCRAYSVQSTLSFDSAEPPPGAKTSDISTRLPDKLPALLAVTVQLTTPVTEHDSVGTLIEGRVSGDVKRGQAVIIPNGSRVHGRIRRLERFQSRQQFIVGLEFTEVEVNGIPMRFYADLIHLDRSKTIRQILTEDVFVVHPGEAVKVNSEKITLPELPGVASFFVQGQSFTLASGFQTVWRTRDYIRGAP
jgi:hypothetical protein